MNLAKLFSFALSGLVLTTAAAQTEGHLAPTNLGEGFRSITVTVPHNEDILFEGIQSAINEFSVSSCAGVAGPACPEGNPIIDTIVTLPKNCKLAPCLPGCSGAGTFKCLPPFNRAGGFMRTSDPSQQISDFSAFEAQGGGSVAVFTYGDGSHEAYYYSEGSGISIIESGGGGGGHQQLMDDIRSQWAAN